MALVAEGLTMLTGVDVAEVHPQVAAEAVITLVGESRRFESVQARVADRFSTSGVWAESGAKSARAWVASQTNEPQGCWFHHHLIHTGEWTLTGDGDEELILTNTVTGEQWTNRPPRNPTSRPD